jgi:predicted nuclease with TOPRIM domain
MEIEAARLAARRLAQELAQIDGRITALAVEAGHTRDEAQSRALLAEHDTLIKRKEVLPLLLRGARVRCLEPLAAELNARAEAAGRARAEAVAVAEAASAEYDAAASAFERAAARLKAAERERDRLTAAHYHVTGEATEFGNDLHRLAQGVELTQPGRFDALC